MGRRMVGMPTEEAKLALRHVQFVGETTNYEVRGICFVKARARQLQPRMKRFGRTTRHVAAMTAANPKTARRRRVELIRSLSEARSALSGLMTSDFEFLP